MNNNKFKVWIEAETWAEGEWDIYNDNTDVTVELEDNTRWVSSFFTYSNINKIAEKNKATGECLNGKYFWSRGMLLVDEISRERIEEVIKHLIDNEEFNYIFNKCFD